MSQEELGEWIQWVLDTIKGSEWKDCDESKHLYVGEDYVGGWAGDERRFFIIDTYCAGHDQVAIANKLVKCWTTWRDYKC